MSNGPFLDLQTLAKVLGGNVSAGQVLAPGPGHSAADRSLSIKLDSRAPDGFVVHSFSKDDPIECRDFVRQKLRMPPFKPNGSGHQNRSAAIAAAPAAPRHPADKLKSKIIAEYNYTDAAGELLYQVVRYEPKDFRQRRPNGHGEWIYNLDGVRRVPYRLPELIEALANGNPVFVVEGEKDADALWELRIPATCNPQGAGKWRDEYSEHFKSATVYVVPDNDEPGRTHARQVADSLAHGVRLFICSNCHDYLIRAMSATG